VSFDIYLTNLYAINTKPIAIKEYIVLIFGAIKIDNETTART
jgi:hypothetical protein